MNLKNVFLIGLCATALSGCMTFDENHPGQHEGQVWRSEVFKPVFALMKVDPSKEDPVRWKKMHLSNEAIQGARTVMVRAKVRGLSGYSFWGRAMVPDSIPSEDLGKGAIVDVLYENVKDVNFENNRFTRIVRLVCSSRDEKCIHRVRNDDTFFTAIDEHPAPGEQFGQTFKKKLSQSEWQAYQDSVKN